MDQEQIKILIADDEALARYAFRALVSKHFPRIKIVGEAESGTQAIEMALSLKPQIIAMDIKMPGINGIEASEAILRESPSTHILILTAYDHFNYIQKALDIGIKGYLLKPFKPEEVIEKVEQAISSIVEESGSSSRIEQVENKIRTIKPFIERELISAIISGNSDIEEIKSYANFLQINIDAGYFMLISFEQDPEESINNSVRFHIMRDKIAETLEKHLPLLKKCVFGNPIGNTFVILFPCDSKSSEGTISNESVVIAGEIQRRIQVITSIKTTIGIGSPYTDIRNLKNSYMEAGLSLRETNNSSTIKHYQFYCADLTKTIQPYPVNIEEELLNELRAGNIEKTKELAGRLIGDFSRNCSSPAFLREYIGQFITMLKRTLLKLGAGISQMTNIALLGELGSIESTEEMILWCRTESAFLIDLAGSLKRNKDVGKISRAMEIVGKNFNKEITLEAVAEEVALTPQYLSKIFKDETGVNFIDYITDKRINYAKQLMLKEKLSITEICSRVGYSDVNYFSRVFKKMTGMTPREYRGIL